MGGKKLPTGKKPLRKRLGGRNHCPGGICIDRDEKRECCLGGGGNLGRNGFPDHKHDFYTPEERVPKFSWAEKPKGGGNAGELGRQKGQTRQPALKWGSIVGRGDQSSKKGPEDVRIEPEDNPRTPDWRGGGSSKLVGGGPLRGSDTHWKASILVKERLWGMGRSIFLIVGGG